MATTAKWALRYPVGTDVPDVPLWMNRLATDLDGVAMDSQGLLSARPAATTSGRYYFATDDTTGSASGTLYRATGSVWVPIAMFPTAVVTSLPASPVSGQICVLQTSAMATAKVRWTLQYNGTKWEFLGGAPFTVQVNTEETTTSTTYAALATAGPALALPVAGDYRIEHGCLYSNSGAFSGAMSYDIGATGAVDADSWVHSTGSGIGTQATYAYTASRVNIKTGLTAVTLTAKYHVGSGTGRFSNRYISVIPLLLG